MKPKNPPKIFCKKCKGKGWIQVSKPIKRNGHLIIGGLSVRCDHKEPGK